MNKTIIAIAITALTQATASAGIMTFSGIVTDVEIDNGSWPGYFSNVQTKVGDPFHARIDISPNGQRYVGIAYVGGDKFYADTYDNYGFYFLEDKGIVEFFPTMPVWGGTDWYVYMSSTEFFASAADFIVPEIQPFVHVHGIVTKQNVFVPDTGSTLPLFASALGVLFGFFKLNRGGARA